MEGSPKACWDDRCEITEKTILLDPTVRADIDLIDVNSKGEICPSFVCVGSGVLRIQRSIELYGLNLPNLVGARKRVIRDVNNRYEHLMNMVIVANDAVGVADNLEVDKLLAQLRSLTLADKPFSKAARAQLNKLPYGQEICAQPEDVSVAAYIEVLGESRAPGTVKQHLAAIRMLFDWLVIGQVVPHNPAAPVRGPKEVIAKGKTPVSDPSKARHLLDSIATETVVGCAIAPAILSRRNQLTKLAA
jgi:hypothetical protein